MSSENFTEMRGFSHYGQPSLTNELETNLKSYLDWNFLCKGAFKNITTETYGPYGGDYSVLHVVDDPSYTDNTVYQAIRKDFVWETGVNYSSPTGGNFNPLPVQVYADNTIVSTGDYYVDYPLGRIVFSTPTTSVITAQYSLREVQVYIADDINFGFEINYDSFNPNDVQWSQNLTSGDYSQSAAIRAQLPAVIIEMAGRTSTKPFELGTLSKFNKQDVLFHVISQSRWERNNIADYLRLQEEKTIILYDISAVYNDNVFPLDERGMLVSNPIMYPSLITRYPYNTARFDKVYISNVQTSHPNLHWAVIRASLEIIL